MISQKIYRSGALNTEMGRSTWRHYDGHPTAIGLEFIAARSIQHINFKKNEDNLKTFFKTTGEPWPSGMPGIRPM